VLFNGLCAFGKLKSTSWFILHLLGALKAPPLTVHGLLLVASLAMSSCRHPAAGFMELGASFAAYSAKLATIAIRADLTMKV